MSAPLSVLVIDDDELSREVIDLHLTAAGHTALPAEHGEAALALLHSLPSPPDLLLSDLHMPGPTGPALLALLHPHLHPDTPVIAMSGSQPPPELIAGYHTFLLKPFTPDDLQQAIRIAQDRALASSNPSTPETPVILLSSIPLHIRPTPAILPTLVAGDDPHPILDIAVFAQLRNMLRTEQLLELFHLSFRELDKHLQRMHAALAVGDAEALHHSAHTVKGSFAVVGARQLQHLGALLEAGTASPADVQATLHEIPLAADRLRGMLSTRGIHLEHHPSPGQEFA